MASNFSRQSFLGGFLAAVSAFLGRKVPDAPAAPPTPAPPPVPPPATFPAIDALGSVTTCVYDASDWDRRMAIAQSLGHITTCTYENGRLVGIDPPPPPLPHWLGDDRPAGPS